MESFQSILIQKLTQAIESLYPEWGDEMAEVVQSSQETYGRIS